MPSDDPGERPPAPAEVRQRWRVTFRRATDPESSPAREVAAAWDAGLRSSGLPIAGLDLPVPRPRFVFGAPLAPGIAADRELMDIFLVARLPVADVREALRASMPPGHELLELRDVWLGEPALPGQVTAADYRVRVRAIDARRAGLAEFQAGCDRLLATGSLPRSRDKGGRSVSYDLRPLLAEVSATAIDLDGLVTLRVRTRFDPERGVGRPEEVVAALAEAMGASLEVLDLVRERLLLAGED
jgi:radical SAM-linked protein